MNSSTAPNENTVTIQRKTPWPFIFLFIIFGLPYLFSWYLLSTDDPIFFKKGQSNGQLIDPPKAIYQLPFSKLPDNTIDTQQFLGKWTLLTITANSCAESCQKNIYDMRQMRLATGVTRSQIKRVLIVSELNDSEGLKEQLADYKGMDVLTGPQKSVESLLNLLENKPENGFNRIYIIDPKGYAMMRYETGFEAKLILKDLDVLLAATKNK